MPAVFFIVGDIAGNVVNAVVNAASPVVDDRVVDDVAVGIDDFDKSVPQDFGKPVAASATKTFDNFLSFAVIREPRYEVQYCLPKLLALWRHFVEAGLHKYGQSFHSHEIVSYNQNQR